MTGLGMAPADLTYLSHNATFAASERLTRVFWIITLHWVMSVLAFQGNMQPPSSRYLNLVVGYQEIRTSTTQEDCKDFALKMESACSSEMPEQTYPTRCNSPEEYNLIKTCRENVKT